MTWWAWTLVFVVLVVGAALLGFVQLRLEQLSDRLADLEQSAPARPSSSVFDDPAALRRRRDRDIADRVRRGRTAARRQTPH
jgi:hypothetical protein